MCGIAGIFELQAGRVPDESLVARMTDVLSHRGPDDAGLLVDPPVTLGHRRLSILDLSPGGHQPMTSPDGRFWIVFNGEIYNYRELAAELRTLGHRFRSSSDTEVLLAAYVQWERGALDRLNGMFAFAIWDRERQRLFCARDRFGVKPFYYVEVAGSFRFASEIKALLLDPAVTRKPNDVRVFDFLAWGYTDHTAETLFANVLQLPPGSTLVVDADRGVGHPERWYEPRPASRNGGPAADELRERLTDAVALRLRSDVPVGTTLSGGLDSTTVTALATTMRGRAGIEPALTFSARCADERIDEGRYMEPVLRLTGAANRSFIPDQRDVLNGLDVVLWHMDEPFHSASVFAHWQLSVLARSEVTVLLDGQGGDEALAGYDYLLYPGYFFTLLREGGVSTALSEARFRHRLQGVSGTQSAKELTKLVLPARIRPRRLPEWIRSGRSHPSPPFPGRSLFDRHLYTLGVHPLPMYNHHADRNTMSVGLESRNPFLDYRVVELGLALRPEEHVHRGYTKWTLREAMRGILPDEVLQRSRKQGFTTDESEWMRGELGALMEQTFRTATARCRSYFDPSRLLSVLGAHRGGVSSQAPELWRAFIVARWLALFIEPEHLEPPRSNAYAPPIEKHAGDSVVRLERPPERAIA